MSLIAEIWNSTDIWTKLELGFRLFQEDIYPKIASQEGKSSPLTRSAGLLDGTPSRAVVSGFREYGTFSFDVSGADVYSLWSQISSWGTLQ